MREGFLCYGDESGVDLELIAVMNLTINLLIQYDIG
jgi:hypothetical protein